MGSVSLNVPKHTVGHLPSNFCICSPGITMVRTGTCAVSGVVQVLSHPGEPSILPNMFSWVNAVKETILSLVLERCCCQDDMLKLQNFKRSWFLVISCKDF